MDYEFKQNLTWESFIEELKKDLTPCSLDTELIRIRLHTRIVEAEAEAAAEVFSDYDIDEMLL